MPRFALVIALALALAGCGQQARQPAEGRVPLTAMSSPDPSDPWEAMNRATLQWMLDFDDAIAKPVALAYRNAFHPWVRTRIRNVVDNLQEPTVAANRLLQGRLDLAAQSAMRVVVNTTLGLGGLFDLAEIGGPPKQVADLGQTLAVWGIPDGPYLMIPFVGPSTPRDFAGQVGNGFLNPISYPLPFLANIGRGLTMGLDERERNIGALEDLRANSLDPYARMRSLWRQNRDTELGINRAEAPTILDDPGADSAVAPAPVAAQPVATRPQRKPRRR